MKPDPFCDLCIHADRGKVVGNVTHTLGACPEGKLRILTCQRHDTAVRIIHTAIDDGNKGALKILTDLGKFQQHQQLQQDQTEYTRQTLPTYLLQEQPSDACKKRPQT